MKDELISIKNALEKNGYKFTMGRRIVLKTVLDSKIHQNVNEIHEKVKERTVNGIGLATIYRALKIFSQLGIMKEININGVSYYEMKMYSKKPLHIHFKCLNCNSIIDIDSQNLNFEYLKLNKKVEAENNLVIYDVNIMYTGLCGKCREVWECQDQQNSGK